MIKFRRITKTMSTTMLATALVLGMSGINNVETVSAKSKNSTKYEKTYLASKHENVSYDDEGNVTYKYLVTYKYNKHGQILNKKETTTNYSGDEESIHTVEEKNTYWKNGNLKSHVLKAKDKYGQSTYINKYDKYENETYGETVIEHTGGEYKSISKYVSKSKNTYSKGNLKKRKTISERYNTTYSSQGELVPSGKTESVITYKYKGKKERISIDETKDYYYDSVKAEYIPSGTSVYKYVDKYVYKKGVLRKKTTYTEHKNLDINGKVVNKSDFRISSKTTYDKKGRELKVLSYRDNGKVSYMSTHRYNKKHIVKYSTKMYDEDGKITSGSETINYPSGKYAGLAKTSKTINSDGTVTKYTYKYKLDKHKNMVKGTSYSDKKVRAVSKYSKYKKYKVKVEK